ncbi:hypothetical protein ISS30_10600 [bacterium]|nr:hypothetical protein [bacterium]
MHSHARAWEQDGKIPFWQVLDAAGGCDLPVFPGFGESGLFVGADGVRPYRG